MVAVMDKIACGGRWRELRVRVCVVVVRTNACVFRHVDEIKSSAERQRKKSKRKNRRDEMISQKSVYLLGGFESLLVLLGRAQGVAHGVRGCARKGGVKNQNHLG